MIETIGILGNLLWLAEKAGFLQFDLDALLTAYLGTVQIVGDFADYRARILGRFRDVLDTIEKGVLETQPNLQADNVKGPEIYIVAHSEGTVVAFMGLLQAMCDQEESPPLWTNWVRGIMTIGSPIDKHLILWPDIWDPVQQLHRSLKGNSEQRDEARLKIQWRNYYDYGDPVGFKLDTTRNWLQVHGWRDRIFDFWGEEDKLPSGRNDDYGFARYLLPGAAHNDYWTDKGVFGHFLENVVFGPDSLSPQRFPKPPANKPFRSLASNVIPHLLVFGLIYLGTYFLYKAVADHLDVRLLSDQITEAVGKALHSSPQSSEAVSTGRDLLKSLPQNVFGISALLAGVTALARIPRLTRKKRWIFGATGIFVIGAVLYIGCDTAEAHRDHAFKIFQSPQVQSILGTRVSQLQRGIASALFVVAVAALLWRSCSLGQPRKESVGQIQIHESASILLQRHSPADYSRACTFYWLSHTNSGRSIKVGLARQSGQSCWRAPFFFTYGG